MKKKELLKSPVRDWKDTSKAYDRILLVPTGTKHDSGYMHIAVIGVTKGDKGNPDTYEIAAYPDDISTYFPINKGTGYEFAQVRMDCLYPSGILQYHGVGKFTVSESLSSIDIRFTPTN